MEPRAACERWEPVAFEPGDHASCDEAPAYRQFAVVVVNKAKKLLRAERDLREHAER